MPACRPAARSRHVWCPCVCISVAWYARERPHTVYTAPPFPDLTRCLWVCVCARARMSVCTCVCVRACFVCVFAYIYTRAYSCTYVHSYTSGCFAKKSRQFRGPTNSWHTTRVHTHTRKGSISCEHAFFRSVSLTNRHMHTHRHLITRVFARERERERHHNTVKRALRQAHEFASLHSCGLFLLCFLPLTNLFTCVCVIVCVYVCACAIVCVCVCCSVCCNVAQNVLQRLF